MFFQTKPFSYELHIEGNASPILCQVTPSDRKSLSIQVKKDGTVTVRSPYFLSRTECIHYIEEKSSWILQNYQKVTSKAVPPLTQQQLQQLTFLEKKFRKAAKDYIPKRVAYFHSFTGGTYTSITVRDQKSRWGSCSSRGTLSFNYRLMLAPPEILDYVVVHELCHLTHMNHSKDFWHMVESILPDYRTAKRYLKEHGHELTLEHYLFSET